MFDHLHLITELEATMSHETTSCVSGREYPVLLAMVQISELLCRAQSFTGSRKLVAKLLTGQQLIGRIRQLGVAPWGTMKISAVAGGNMNILQSSKGSWLERETLAAPSSSARCLGGTMKIPSYIELPGWQSAP